MTDAAARTAAAERQRRYRARQRSSAVVASVEVSLDAVEELVALGLLHPHRDDDREAISEALAELLRRHLEKVTRNAT